MVLKTKTAGLQPAAYFRRREPSRSSPGNELQFETLGHQHRRE